MEQPEQPPTTGLDAASLRLVANSAPIPMWVTLSDGSCKFVNQAFADFLGLDAESALHIDWRALLHPDDRERAVAAISSGMAQGGPVALEARFRRADGAWRWLQAVSQPRRDAAGGYIGVAYDVTEAKEAEQALRTREEMLSALISQSTAGFAEVDLTGRFTFVNDRFCTIVDRSREDLLRLTLQEITHADDLSRNLSLFERAVREGTPYVHDKRYLRPDGSAVWVNNSVSVIRTPSGEPRGVLAVTIDVTERRLQEAQARESEARLRALTDNLPGGMVFQITTGSNDEERRFVFVSDSFEKLTGIPASAVTADPALPYKLILPEDAAPLAAAEAVSIANRSLFDREARFRRADGEVRWSRIISAPRVQADGSLIWDGLQIDITDQKAAEAALRQSEEHLSTALSVAQLGTYVYDPACGDIRLDERSRLLFEIDGEKVPVKAIFERIAEEDRDRTLREVKLAHANRQRLRIEYRLTLPSGTPRIILSLSDAVRGGDGSTAHILGVWADVTERKEMEENLHRLNHRLEGRVAERTAELERVSEQLHQSQKLEAMGQLTGGVAHDFNNLLTPILGTLDLLQRREIGGEREQRMIGAALDAAERAKSLVQRLLAFARKQPLQPGPVQLGRLLGGMTDLLAGTLGPQISLRVEVAADLPPAHADANQLEMAILNLCVNARDAMPEGGVLTIACSLELVAAGTSSLPAGDYLALTVADTGSGMDDATLARAIEPFFSTKGLGKGTGLGLSMVHGLASQLGGALTLSSAAGAGTQVRLLLPRSEQQLGGDAVAGNRSSRHVGMGAVLLVDDEAGVRTTTADLLRDMGYEVVEAGSGAEAIELLQSNSVDLMLTDQMMPGMSGARLVEHVREVRPELPILLVSGFHELVDVPEGIDRLLKPFRHHELAAAIEQLLQRHAQRA